LDDEELITVLADTKLKSTDVKEKLIAAAVLQMIIYIRTCTVILTSFTLN